MYTNYCTVHISNKSIVINRISISINHNNIQLRICWCIQVVLSINNHFSSINHCIILINHNSLRIHFYTTYRSFHNFSKSHIPPYYLIWPFRNSNTFIVPFGYSKYFIRHFPIGITLSYKVRHSLLHVWGMICTSGDP